MDKMISNPEAYGLGHADSDSVNLGSNPGPPATQTINENQRLEPATANRKRRKNRTDSVQGAAQESAQTIPVMLTDGSRVEWRPRTPLPENAAILRSVQTLDIAAVAARCGLTIDQVKLLVRERLFPKPNRCRDHWYRRDFTAFVDEAEIKPPILQDCYVYFMRMGHFIKIGQSASPYGRMANLQVGSPYPISMIAMLPGREEDEQRMHRICAALRLKTEGAGNEWFRATPGLWVFIWWLCKLHSKKPGDELRDYIEAKWPSTFPARDPVRVGEVRT